MKTPRMGVSIIGVRGWDYHWSTEDGFQRSRTAPPAFGVLFAWRGWS